MNRKIGKGLFLLGFSIFLISYLLPIDLFSSFTNLKPTGLTSLFFCPVIGIIGIIFSIREKDKLFIAMNLLIILILPISMLLRHL